MSHDAAYNEAFARSAFKLGFVPAPALEELREREGEPSWESLVARVGMDRIQISMVESEIVRLIEVCKQCRNVRYRMEYSVPLAEPCPRCARKEGRASGSADGSQGGHKRHRAVRLATDGQPSSSRVGRPPSDEMFTGPPSSRRSSPSTPASSASKTGQRPLAQRSSSRRAERGALPDEAPGPLNPFVARRDPNTGAGSSFARAHVAEPEGLDRLHGDSPADRRRQILGSPASLRRPQNLPVRSGGRSALPPTRKHRRPEPEPRASKPARRPSSKARTRNPLALPAFDWRKPQTWLLLTMAAGLLFVVGWSLWPAPAVRHPPGVLVPQDPRQLASDTSVAWLHNGYWLKPQARFVLSARVLSREPYSSGREADVSPIDLALGWRKMSDQAVVDQVGINQFNRFYTWWAGPDTGATRDEITTSSANMHMIPATPEVEDLLMGLQVGEIIDLEGYLVEVEHPDGWVWKTSMSREDTGPGACELIWVDKLTVREQP